MAADTPTEPNVTDSLALAMVSMSDAPLLLLHGDLRIIAASGSFCRAVHIDPASVSGCPIFDLGDGEWNLPRLRSLLTATASGHAAVDAYEMDLQSEGREPRRLIIKAQKLDYGDADTRLLMTVADVTDARLAAKVKDQLIQDKAMLLQEVQHRVANSLQIIASVLLQSARNVNSDETRTHLHDAHNRVMSIATLQNQLASSGEGEVALRPYFTQLCHSLGASMIRDHDKLKIKVDGDDSRVTADVSVSLGLIVTELVINCLKHAFPDGRAGKIRVDYDTDGPHWTLTVADNGIGMPPISPDAHVGLGSSIVDALARQLHARVSLSDGNPGTTVSIIHSHLSLVENEPASAAL